METGKQKLIRHAVSFCITFFAAALLAFIASLLGAIDTGEALTSTLFFSLASGAFMAGLRAILKFLQEKLESAVPVLGAWRK